MSTSVAVVDYGMGNLHSIGKALEHVGADVTISADRDSIMSADRVVFPGVGAIRDSMAELKRLHLAEVVKEAAATKPVLGVCLGMQAMLEFSEENGGIDCLGLIPGAVRHFADRDELADLKIPHMGWNNVRQHASHPLWADIPQDSRFYFVHSYYAAPTDTSTISGSCLYGVEFAAVLARDNLFATQFHPEKSQVVGLKLLSNFLNWSP
ncbi:MAG: imidazole glycerol phosphate synthase subunit HisH [Gammaproteobacteria bacterium]